MCLIVSEILEGETYVLTYKNADDEMIDEIHSYEHPMKLIERIESMTSDDIISIKATVIANRDHYLLFAIPFWCAKEENSTYEIYPSRNYTRYIDQIIHEKAKIRSSPPRYFPPLVYHFMI